jgi:hypothetical protein
MADHLELNATIKTAHVFLAESCKMTLKEVIILNLLSKYQNFSTTSTITLLHSLQFILLKYYTALISISWNSNVNLKSVPLSHNGDTRRLYKKYVYNVCCNQDFKTPNCSLCDLSYFTLRVHLQNAKN